jgi:hypothetical protein
MTDVLSCYVHKVNCTLNLVIRKCVGPVAFNLLQKIFVLLKTGQQPTVMEKAEKMNFLFYHTVCKHKYIY